MDYYRNIERTIDFIETHLKENMTIFDASKVAYLSPFHFHRLFHALIGDSIGEYIRKRRLASAAKELIQTKKGIIEIALDYQFESQRSFSRSFKKETTVTPGQYRKDNFDAFIYERQSIKPERLSLFRNEIQIRPRIIRMDAVPIIGKSLRTTIDHDKCFQDIARFWHQFASQHLDQVIPNRTSADMIGLICDEDEQGYFSYLIASYVSNLDDIPRGMTGRIIPQKTYAVFTAKGIMPKAMENLYDYIYGLWLPESGYEKDDSGDVSFYTYHDKRSAVNTPETEHDIYFPIKESNS